MAVNLDHNEKEPPEPVFRWLYVFHADPVFHAVSRLVLCQSQVLGLALCRTDFQVRCKTCFCDGLKGGNRGRSRGPLVSTTAGFAILDRLGLVPFCHPFLGARLGQRTHNTKSDPLCVG